MKLQRNWKRIAIGTAAGLALTAGVMTAATVAPTIANAQETVAELGLNQVRWSGQRDGFGTMAGCGCSRMMLDPEQALADVLGITVEELETAKDAARDAAIAAAVEAGTITQDQADELADQDGLGFGGRGFGRLDIDSDHQALMAEALGISEEELEAAHEQAGEVAISTALEEGLITQAQADDLTVAHMVKTAIYHAQETALDAAVEAGLITQAQADAQMRHYGMDGQRGHMQQRGHDRGRDGFGGRGQRNGDGSGPGSGGQRQLGPATAAPEGDL
ncbi:MAG: hypothetical protein HC802_03930 [Caldilineaceae bacterium]|nr:hypothetical protein [Caldilineaceae bacterium]